MQLAVMTPSGLARLVYSPESCEQAGTYFAVEQRIFHPGAGDCIPSESAGFRFVSIKNDHMPTYSAVLSGDFVIAAPPMIAKKEATNILDEVEFPW